MLNSNLVYNSDIYHNSDLNTPTFNLISKKSCKQKPLDNCIITVANARSIANKKNMTEQFLFEHGASIACFTETWLKDSNFPIISSFQNFFDIFACNRTASKQGRGCLILMNKSLNGRLIFTQSIEYHEILIVDAQLCSNIRIICLYRPPNGKYTILTQIVKIIYKFLTDRTIIVGDLNLPKYNWGEPYKNNSSLDNFSQFIINNNFKQWVNQPTRGDSILDICLCNSEIIESLTLCPGLSDHDALKIKLTVKNVRNKTHLLVRDYSKYNLELLNLDFTTFFRNDTVQFQLFTLDDKYQHLTKNIINILDSYFPLKPVQKTLEIKYPNYIKSLIAQKRYLWKCVKISRTYKPRYDEISKEVRKEIYAYNLKKEIKISKDQKNLTKFIRNNTQPITDIPPLEYNNARFTDEAQKAEIFADIFSQSFNNDYDTAEGIPSLNPLKLKTILSDFNFSIYSIEDELKRTQNKCNTSPDGISFNILKKCRLSLAEKITEIFQICLSSASSPNIWKESIIIPIPKSTDLTNPLKYRPISLGCSINRIFERIIAKEILKHMFNNDLIDKNQFGFLPARSTTSQLIKVFEEYYQNLFEKNCTNCIFIDLKKAFDQVPHSLLLEKLWYYGIRGKIHAWFINYFDNRSFRVKVGSKLSSSRKIKSGVPQGSPLGPLLFNIYINDLPKIIPRNISIKLYADDIKLITNDNHPQNLKLMQYALDQIEKWGNDWKLMINAEKTWVFKIGPNRHNNQTDYYYKGTKLAHTDIIRDLGISYSNKLSFTKHINLLVRNSHYKIIHLFRLLKNKDKNTWLRIYKIYIRPQLEYATQIWNPNDKASILKVEKIQKIFTRKLYYRCKINYTNYNNRCKFLNLQTLEIRRRIIDLCTLFKICKNMMHLYPSEFIKFSSRPMRMHKYQLILKQRDSKTQNSFINRTSTIWNNMPGKIINIDNIKLFRIKVTEYLNTLEAKQ